MDSKLAKLLDSKKTPHSLLITSKDLEALKEHALQFAKEWMQIESLPHPDLFILQPVGKSAQFNIETLRGFKDEVFKPPYVGTKKLFLLIQAERMAPVSANALLKVFEEPLETSYIFLLSTAPHELLPTVRSRCQEIKLSEGYRKRELPEELKTFLTSPQPLSLLDLIAFTENLALNIEKKVEEELPPEEKVEESSAQQREVLEKQLEAMKSLKMTAYLEDILISHLHWIRDLHLLRAEADSNLLFYPEYFEILKLQSQRKEIQNLDKAERAVKHAMLSYERFTPLSTVLFDYFTE